MNSITILKAIPSTELADFGEFCTALGADKPDDRAGWADLFSTLSDLEEHGLIEVSRSGRTIDTLILTEAGTALVKNEK